MAYNSNHTRGSSQGARKIVRLFEEIEVAPFMHDEPVGVDSVPSYNGTASLNSSDKENAENRKETTTTNVAGKHKIKIPPPPPPRKKRISLVLRPDRRKSNVSNQQAPPKAKEHAGKSKKSGHRRSLSRFLVKNTSAPEKKSEVTIDKTTGETTSKSSIHERFCSHNDLLVDITSSLILSTTFSTEEVTSPMQDTTEIADSVCGALERCSTFDSAGDSLMYAGYSLKESYSTDSFNTFRSFSKQEELTLSQQQQLHAQRRHKSKYYFQTEDFDTYNWKGMQSAVHSNLTSSVGMAVVATATVIVHPILFLAGAIWAVGMFHAVEHGYKFYSDGTFGAMFWGDEDDDQMQKINHTQSRLFNDQGSEPEVEQEPPVTCSPFEEVASMAAAPFNQGKALSQRSSAGVPPPPPPPSLSHSEGGESVATSVASLTSNQSLEEEIAKHFKPLEVEVVSNVPFPNIHATEFFRVFFSDAAPYSMKDFQEERGDIEINFGNWQKVTSFTPTEEQAKVGFLFPAPFKAGHVRERSTSFKTLTKSAFGPSYATASTRQRVTRVKDQFIIIENQTQLLDIPYGDRFVVLERWVVSTKRSSDQDQVESFVTAHLEVKMLKSCSFERQIRKKTATTMKSYVESWCAKATEALSLAEKQKAERIRKASAMALSDAPAQKRASTEKQEEGKEISDRQVTTGENERLLAAHKEKLHAIKGKISNGEFNYAFEHVETTHSIDKRAKPITLYTDSFGESGTIVPSSPDFKMPQRAAASKRSR